MSRFLFFIISIFQIILSQKSDKFDRFDINDDKLMSFDEFLRMEPLFQEERKREFDLIDRNKDEKLTKDEFKKHSIHHFRRSDILRRQYFTKVFEEFDIDEDHRLDQNEVRHLLKVRFLVRPRENFPKIFYNFDLDHSGSLDLREYIRFDQGFPFDQSDPLNAQTGIVDNSMFNLDINADSFVTAPPGFQRKL